MSGIPHGTKTRYSYGCRCDECKAANREYALAAKQRRIARGKTDPSVIPHGTRGGYGNWGCRCDRCAEANAACLRAARTADARNARRETAAENATHGTLSGYTYWGCRCSECCAAIQVKVARYETRLNAKTLQKATRHYQPWTGPELEIAGRTDLSDRKVAEMLGRTVFAVRAARRNLAKEPKFMLLAGLSKDEASER